MCGIAGVVGVVMQPQALADMGAAMRHRGPDDKGSYHQRDVALTMRRLAIVDIEGGRQPMTNEEGNLHLVFNGEIYNHAELREDLCRRGHRFVSDHSDTEVLVHGWEEWEYGLFERLNGMFAVALWDETRHELVLARDRYGIKPLYYAHLPNGGLAFASEIKALFASGLVACQAAHDGVREYFSFQNLWREQTMFRGVLQLDPATTLSWKRGSVVRRRFWDLAFPRSRRESLPDLAAAHRDILKRAIHRQIQADVPVMTYLSGGIDSTSISVIAAEVDPQLTTYSCVFDLEGVGADRIVDEREFSRLVAESNNLARVELQLPQDSLAACLNDYVTAVEDLRMGMAYVNYLIAQRVAQDAKAVLSGTGGDEYHAGYVWRYRQLGLTGDAPSPGSWHRRLAHILRRILQRGGSQRPPPGKETLYFDMLNFVVPADRQRDAFTPEFLAETQGYDPRAVFGELLSACPSNDWRDRVFYVDARTYLTGLLVVEDKVSMAHSLEARVPLLDNDLIDFLLDVPFEMLCHGEMGKIMFRESVRPWVPDAIYRKPKMGFGPPDASWYRGSLRPWIEERLSEERIRGRGVMTPIFVRQALEDHFSARRDNTYLIWSLLSFEAWCEVFGMYN